GLAAPEYCPVRRREWLPVDAELLPCSWHHLDDGELITIWPPEYHEWAKSRSLVVPRMPRVPSATRVQSQPGDDLFRIASPADGSTYLIDPTLRREFQTLSLRVIASSGGAVEWWIDGRPLARTNADPAGGWSLAPGTHTFSARDEYG